MSNGSTKVFIFCLIWLNVFNQKTNSKSDKSADKQEVQVENLKESNKTKKDSNYKEKESNYKEIAGVGAGVFGLSLIGMFFLHKRSRKNFEFSLKKTKQAHSLEKLKLIEELSKKEKMYEEKKIEMQKKYGSTMSSSSLELEKNQQKYLKEKSYWEQLNQSNKTKLEKKTRELERLTEEVRSLKTEVEEKQRQRLQERSKWEELEKSIRTDLEKKQQELEELSQTNKKISHEKSSSDSLYESNQSELKRKNEELERLTQELRSLKTEVEEQQKRELKEKSEWNDVKEKIRTDIENTQQQLESLSQKNQKLSEEKTDLYQLYESSQTELEKKNEELERLAQEVTYLKYREEDSREEKSNSERLYQSSQTELEKKKQELKRLTEEVRFLKTEVEETKRQRLREKSYFKKRNESIQTELEKKKQELEELSQKNRKISQQKAYSDRLYQSNQNELKKKNEELGRLTQEVRSLRKEIEEKEKNLKEGSQLSKKIEKINKQLKKNGPDPLLDVKFLGLLLKDNNIDFANKIMRLKPRSSDLIRNFEGYDDYEKLLNSAIEKGLNNLSIGNMLEMGKTYFAEKATKDKILGLLNQLLDHKERYNQAVIMTLLRFFSARKDASLKYSENLVNKMVKKHYYHAIFHYWSICEGKVFSKKNPFTKKIITQKIWLKNDSLAHRFFKENAIAPSSIKLSAIGTLIENRADNTLSYLVQQNLIKKGKKKLIKGAIEHVLPLTIKKIFEKDKKSIQLLQELDKKNTPFLKKLFVLMARPSWKEIYEYYKKIDAKWKIFGSVDPLLVKSGKKEETISTRHIINFLWLNRLGKRNVVFSNQFVFTEKHEKTNALYDTFYKWAINDPYADIYVWYDSKYVTTYSLQNSRFFLEASKLNTQVKLKDIRTLNSLSTDPKTNKRLQRINERLEKNGSRLMNQFQKIFTEKEPVYFRADLLRLIITEEQVESQVESVDDSFYFDFDMNPCPRTSVELSVTTLGVILPKDYILSSTKEAMEGYRETASDRSIGADENLSDLFINRKKTIFNARNIENLTLVGVVYKNAKPRHKDYTENSLHCLSSHEPAGTKALKFVLDDLIEGYVTGAYQRLDISPQFIYDTVMSIITLSYIEKGYVELFKESSSTPMKIEEIRGDKTREEMFLTPKFQGKQYTGLKIDKTYSLKIIDDKFQIVKKVDENNTLPKKRKAKFTKPSKKSEKKEGDSDLDDTDSEWSDSDEENTNPDGLKSGLSAGKYVSKKSSDDSNLSPTGIESFIYVPRLYLEARSGVKGSYMVE